MSIAISTVFEPSETPMGSGEDKRIPQRESGEKHAHETHALHARAGDVFVYKPGDLPPTLPISSEPCATRAVFIGSRR
jgi:hypothetical protein